MLIFKNKLKQYDETTKTSEDFCASRNIIINDAIFFPLTKYTVQQYDSDFKNEAQVENIIPFIHIPDCDIPDNKKDAMIFLVWSKHDFQFILFLVIRPQEISNEEISKKRHDFFEKFILWPCENFSHDSVRFNGKEILLRTRIYFKMAENNGDDEDEEGDEFRWNEEDHLHLQYLLIKIYSQAHLHCIKETLIKLAVMKRMDEDKILKMISEIDEMENEKDDHLPTIFKCLSDYILENVLKKQN